MSRSQQSQACAHYGGGRPWFTGGSDINSNFSCRVGCLFSRAACTGHFFTVYKTPGIHFRGFGPQMSSGRVWTHRMPLGKGQVTGSSPTPPQPGSTSTLQVQRLVTTVGSMRVFTTTARTWPEAEGAAEAVEPLIPQKGQTSTDTSQRLQVRAASKELHPGEPGPFAAGCGGQGSRS